MIFNVSGGGGAALNFRVVGNPQPANPTENCIWVDTDTPITSWIFSATQPSPAEPGMVWISIGTSSTVEFNALKKNGIQVYPISAKQYVGGAWVDKTAKSYQGGELVKWATYLYDNGDRCVDITGGWARSSVVLDSSHPNTGSLSFDSTKITMSGDSKCCYITTEGKVDLTPYSKLCVRWKITNNQLSLGITSGKSGAVSSVVVASVVSTTTTSHVTELNIAEYSGGYYILAGVISNWSGEIYEIWLA